MSFIINPYRHAASNGLLTDLESYYKLDEASGTIQDSHGSNDGTNNGATYGATGIINDALDFDGTNDRVSMGNVLSFDARSEALSASAWIKCNNFSSQMDIINKQNATTPYTGLAIRVRTDAQINFLLRGSDSPLSNVIERDTDTTISTGSWYHIVCTHDGSGDASGMTIYINGSSQAVTTLYDNLTTTTENTADFQIGARGTAGGFFDGIIDEVGIWSRELSSTDVANLYNSGSGLAYSSFN